MLIPIYKNKFEKDIKRLKKRGKGLAKLTIVMRKIVDEEELEKKYKEHSLKGEYADC